MADFVKELFFQPRTEPEGGDLAIANAFRNAWKSPFNLLMRSVKAQRTHKSVVEATCRFKNVSSVRVHFTSMGDPTRVILTKTLPLIHSTLQHHAENLTLLAITVPLVEASNLLRPSLVLPRLKILNLFLYRRLEAPHADSVGNILATSILPFINNHAQTLEAFRIMEHTRLDLTVLFKRLRHIPNLKKLYFPLTIKTEGHHVRTFLHRHSDTLRDITIQTYNAREPENSFDSVARHLFEIQTPVPDLQRLDIWFADHSGSLANPEIFGQVAFTNNSLVSLELTNQKLDFAALSSLLLSDTHSFQRLRTLVIEVYELTPVAMDLFAERLVNLYDLKLKTRLFQPVVRNFIDVSDIRRIHQVSTSLILRYSSWHLFLFFSFASRFEVVTIGHGRSKICL